jgi:GrpB-like predicted nucleotidyltransferase (UPF0157 family)
MGQQLVVPYDPEWPRRFAAERERLESVLAPWLVAGIHHIGSTAVPGLAAKPVIDMMAGVRSLEEARAAFEPLEALGYHYREHRPEAHLFWTPTHGVHLTEPGSDLWRERLAFRDALRANPALAAEYAEWKMRHAETGPDARGYTAKKTPLVARVLAEAGIDLKPDSVRLSGQGRR